MIVRDPDDPRDATLTWQPVKGADGYVVRYGIEPEKLYNNYMVYDAIPSPFTVSTGMRNIILRLRHLTAVLIITGKEQNRPWAGVQKLNF